MSIFQGTRPVKRIREVDKYATYYVYSVRVTA